MGLHGLDSFTFFITKIKFCRVIEFVLCEEGLLYKEGVGLHLGHQGRQNLISRRCIDLAFFRFL
jgi:hypothetical protein